ncbi:Cytochrome c oxidase accessory protein CcoG [Candidatus Jidaibacter acanthamoeba]|uniref:Cytochrome c oxidase accessory protein CcoG n=1 Tax=Candidatus Jidaibacter acanthamoebae TaxID=86105 RepID=A0A0C1QZD8_9RICK|nr:cytochrome c oxidase accessory protein CcoG [Candidatus Jidaibacter acanthamoeba]KIE05385.1 Cytochrome c oxidase accessory protein CcoG [Candidatus Jidaibacter acanthamoeba]
MAKIYPQIIKGKFRSIKDITLIGLFLLYFCGSWIRWGRGERSPDQALLIDLPNRRAYLFGIEIWPDEIYYITGALILAALGLFFVTSLLGRIWCGYTCPHTVFTDIFLKIETFFQGDRNKRIKLDSSSYDIDKLTRKVATHISWLGIGFLFAFGWVGYFYDVKKLLQDLITLKVSGNATIWLFSLTASTYLFAGFVRQRVCMYMCPYGRFQSAMIDKETVLVTYDNERGEPRAGEGEQERGDCISCNKCVVVCPMGIDIRDGLQMECINCGLCVDACNSVMEKIGKPLDLIGYKSSVISNDQQKSKTILKHIFRAKTIIFSLVFVIVAGVMLYSLTNKSTCILSVSKDHGALFTVIPDGSIRNTYDIKIFNKSSRIKNTELTIEGMENIKFMVQDISEYVDKYNLKIKPDAELEYRVFIKIPNDNYNFKQKDIKFILKDLNTNEIIVKHNSFVVSR